jgi:hypothetical protein
MKFSIASAKLTGNPGDSGWAQVHEFKPDDEEKLRQRGHFFAVIATTRQEEGVDSVVAGRELLARLHEEYFGNTTASAFNSLKEAVERVIKEFSSTWGDVQIVAASVLGDVVYSAAGGGGRVAIFRDGMLANILVSSSRDTVSASGYPKEGDILILGTRSFFQALPAGSLKAALEGKEPKNTAESLAPAVHSAKESGSLGVVFIKFEKKDVFVKGLDKEEGKIERQGKVQEIILGNFEWLRRRAGSFGRRIRDRLIPALARKLPEKRIYIRSKEKVLEEAQNKRLAVSVGLILLVLLVVSIGFGIKQRRSREERARYEPRLIQAKHELEESIDLYSLNPVRSRELFASSKSIAEQLAREGVSDPELEVLKEMLEENRGTILGEYEGTTEHYLDLSLLSSGFEGSQLSMSDGRLFVLDKKGGRIVGISIDTKKTEVVAGPDQVEEAEHLASYSDRVFVMTASGIYEVGDEAVKVIEKDWQGDALVYSYAANLYVLDKQASTIWRYAGTEESFGSKKSWFAAGVEPDLSGVISWTIDDSIWLLFDSGQIQKYSLGNPSAFNVSGFQGGLEGALSIYTDEESGFLYVLDPANRRVVVLDKNGDYQAQYISEEIAEAKDLAVSEKDGKIILLAGGKLFSIEIRHLE